MSLATLEAAIRLGLSEQEYAHVCEIQGGEPTHEKKGG